jgi:PAS domain-containing protein
MRPLEVPPFFRIAIDRIVMRCPQSYPTYIRTDVCLAYLVPDGTFRLLSAAWERLLGLCRSDLHGRALLEILEGKPPRVAGETALRRMLSPAEADPVTLELRCKDGGVVCMRCYRRFDPYDLSLFIAGEPAELKVARGRAPSGPDPA